MRARILTMSWAPGPEVAPLAPGAGPLRVIRNPVDALPYVAPWAAQSSECLLLVLLDKRMRILGVREVARGTRSACPASVREVLAAAVISSAAAMILAHNHPSGDTTPSAEDISATARIRAAAELAEVPLLDHIIIGVDDSGAIVHNSAQSAGWF